MEQPRRRRNRGRRVRRGGDTVVVLGENVAAGLGKAGLRRFPKPSAVHHIVNLKKTALESSEDTSAPLRFLPGLRSLEHDLPLVDKAAWQSRKALLDKEMREMRGRWKPSKGSHTTANRVQEAVARSGWEAAARAEGEVGVAVRAFGSRVYGVCSSTSDIDLTLYVDLSDEAMDGFLKSFVHELRSCPGFTRVIWIRHMRMPLVKFVHQAMSRDGGGEFEGDISFNNWMGQAKTQMFSAYMAADPRVRPVLTLVKEWSKKRLIAESNVMNSYGLMMMTLAFLVGERVVPPLQLLRSVAVGQKAWKTLSNIHKSPDLVAALYPSSGTPATCLVSGKALPEDMADGQRAYFLNDHDKLDQWRSPNHKPAYVLAYEMFRFYGAEFDPLHDAVSVRLGTPRIPRTLLTELKAPDPIKALKHRDSWPVNLRLLAIEDPFQVELNCARNATGEWVEGLRWEMRRAAWAMARGVYGNGPILGRLLLPPSEEIYCDASVWAPTYDYLLPAFQEAKGVVFAEADANADTLMDLEAWEDGELEAASRDK